MHSDFHWHEDPGPYFLRYVARKDGSHATDSVIRSADAVDALQLAGAYLGLIGIRCNQR